MKHNDLLKEANKASIRKMEVTYQLRRGCVNQNIDKSKKKANALQCRGEVSRIARRRNFGSNEWRITGIIEKKKFLRIMT